MIISESEINVYCQSAKITPQYHKASVVESINSIAANISVSLHGYTFNELVNVTINGVLDSVKQMEWEINDIEGVTWFWANTFAPCLRLALSMILM